MPSKIRLLVGLGNPGREYERTRHNAGWWLVERFAVASGIAMRKDQKYQALVGRHAESGAWLLLPQTFMNASGRSVLMLAGFFRIPPEEVLVVHDELDITCLPDDLPEFIEVDMGGLSIGGAIHVNDLKLPNGVTPVLHRGENQVVATVITPVLVTEEEEAAAEAVPAGEVPTTEQAAPEAGAAEGAPAGDKAAAKPAGDKGAAAGAKPAEKAAEKKEKK